MLDKVSADSNLADRPPLEWSSPKQMMEMVDGWSEQMKKDVHRYLNVWEWRRIMCRGNDSEDDAPSL